MRKFITKRNIRINISDFAVWITNGIQELEKINDIEVHIISPYRFLKNKIQEFKPNNIDYHF